MKASKSSVVKAMFTCGRCSMPYLEYKHLLEHLYWRHGTESFWCNKCSLKRWHYAVHVCHVLPIYCDKILEDDNLKSEEPTYCSERETDFCFCGKFIAEAPMIGCDGPKCALQWFHFACVGISSAPEGDWLCPTCTKQQ